MNKKEKLNRIFLVLVSLFVVMLGYGINPGSYFFERHIK